jgi:hypothetical protein
MVNFNLDLSLVGRCNNFFNPLIEKYKMNNLFYTTKKGRKYENEYIFFVGSAGTKKR